MVDSEARRVRKMWRKGKNSRGQSVLKLKVHEKTLQSV